MLNGGADIEINHHKLQKNTMKHILTKVDNGFTLVEMMVTITILVIALGISIPPMTEWVKNSQVRSSANSLQSALRDAQSQAQIQSRIVAVILSNRLISNNTISVSDVSGDLKHWVAYAIPIDESSEPVRLLKSGSFHNSGNITAEITGGDAVCFNPLGRLSRQGLTKPFTLNCAITPELTLKHSQSKNTPKISISSSGKTKLTY